MYWINRYLYEARPELVLGSDDGTLFLNYNGHPFSPEALSRRVGNYVKKANVGKQGACHIFRHTLATLMLENGADTRYIQEMLGHACLKTTQLYTQVSIIQLKHIHTTTHPGANFTPKQRERLEGKGKHGKQATGTQEIEEPCTLDDAVLLDNEMDEED
jgi:integrase/recombinase XerD